MASGPRFFPMNERITFALISVVETYARRREHIKEGFSCMFVSQL
jgi:hypothetical protein